MSRLAKYALVFALGAVVFPTPALAYENQFTPIYVHLVISATGLAVALILLVEALRLRRIFLGGAIAEKIHFVILGIVCLAGSALAKWTMNFVGDITFEQTELASEMLVLVAMALFAAYFYSVGTAMQSYLKGMQGVQLEPAQTTEAPPAADDSETIPSGSFADDSKAEPRG